MRIRCYKDRFLKKLIGATIVLCVMVLLSGCSGYTWIPPHPDDPKYAPTPPAIPKQVPTLSGSLYGGEFGLDTMFSDLRAYRVGDILTVKLAEKTQANKSSSTSTNKKSTTDVSNPTLFGSTPQFNVPGVIPLVSNKDNNMEFKLDSNNTFAGDGKSSQKNDLLGEITVTVSDVMPNGNLKIRGEKWISLNQGSEFIRLTGIVRPYDIEPDNTISSGKIANPRISYSGTGALADANQQGWFARLFNGPIFPY